MSLDKSLDDHLDNPNASGGGKVLDDLANRTLNLTFAGDEFQEFSPLSPSEPGKSEAAQIIDWSDEKGPTPESIKLDKKGTLVPATRLTKSKNNAETHIARAPKRGKRVRKLLDKFNIKSTKGQSYDE